MHYRWDPLKRERREGRGGVESERRWKESMEIRWNTSGNRRGSASSFCPMQFHTTTCGPKKSETFWLLSELAGAGGLHLLRRFRSWRTALYYIVSICILGLTVSRVRPYRNGKYRYEHHESQVTISSFRSSPSLFS